MSRYVLCEIAAAQVALLIVCQIVGFLAAGLVFTTSSVNSLVYSAVAAFEAAAAGFILLSMIAVRQATSTMFTRPCESCQS
jgi:uncharacterized membrane protein